MRRKKSRSGISILLIIALIMVGCAPVYYAPNAHNVPLFSEKSEATVSASYAILDNPGPIVGTDLQLAIAVTDHVGIMANGMFTKSIYEDIDGSYLLDAECKGQFFELGGGYFQVVDKTSITGVIFETYGGIGFGNYLNSSNNDIWPSSASFQRLFLQPSIGFKSRYFEAAFSMRLAGLNYSKYSMASAGPYLPMDIFSVLLEPAMTLRAGLKGVKLQWQVGFSKNLNNPKLLQSQIYFGFSILARIPATTSIPATQQPKFE